MTGAHTESAVSKLIMRRKEGGDRPGFRPHDRLD
jgi:hypothetical protein